MERKFFTANRIFVMLLLLAGAPLYSQQGNWEFSKIHNRMEVGWVDQNISGDVEFTGEDIVITMPGKRVVLHVLSKLQFIRVDQYLYECENDAGARINIRTYCDTKRLEEVILYFYSDIPGEKYIKIFLKKC